MISMTIGEILSNLELFRDDRQIELSDGRFFDGNFGSYRGYYNHMHLGYSHADCGYNTVKTLKRLLNRALSRGLMWGYKGGEYGITVVTPVWLADGTGDCSGDMITEIKEVGDTVVISVVNVYTE